MKHSVFIAILLETLQLSSALIVALLFTSVSYAADFSIEKWRGASALHISGVIEQGDQETFQNMISQISTRAYGAKVVLLDSSGGNVGAAFDISKEMDAVPVHTVVPDGGICASACASLLFVGGRYRTVEFEGLLGQHSCDINGVPLQECNDLLAEHALSNGVSYGSIGAFVSNGPPGEIIFFSRENADCFGITFYPLQEGNSFDNIEPCVVRNLGMDPEIHDVWRIDFEANGYRAFVRLLADDIRELELGIYCRKIPEKRFFVTVDISGPRDMIASTFKKGSVLGSGLMLEKRVVTVVQVDSMYSRAQMRIPEEEVSDFLTNVDVLTVRLEAIPPYDDIVVTSNIGMSRRVLKFAASNCAF